MFSSKLVPELQLPQCERTVSHHVECCPFWMSLGDAAFFTSVALLTHVQLSSTVTPDPFLKMFPNQLLSILHLSGLFLHKCRTWCLSPFEFCLVFLLHVFSLLKNTSNYYPVLWYSCSDSHFHISCEFYKRKLYSIIYVMEENTKVTQNKVKLQPRRPSIWLLVTIFHLWLKKPQTNKTKPPNKQTEIF